MALVRNRHRALGGAQGAFDSLLNLPPHRFERLRLRAGGVGHGRQGCLARHWHGRAHPCSAKVTMRSTKRPAWLCWHRKAVANPHTRDRWRLSTLLFLQTKSSSLRAEFSKRPSRICQQPCPMLPLVLPEHMLRYLRYGIFKAFHAHHRMQPWRLFVKFRLGIPLTALVFMQRDDRFRNPQSYQG